VGSLVYLAAATRPDIAFAVNKTARVMDRPTENNWNKIKRIFCYLRSTSNYGLKYTCGSGELKVFIEVDFAGDKVTRRFTNVLAILTDDAVSWTSRVQKTTALSTTEARSLEQVKELKS
jgi:hypothetical protein